MVGVNAGSTARDLTSAYRGARVLVTGGIGFIGSSIARRLVECGAIVTLVDSLVPEYGGNLRNLAGIEDSVTVNISDVRDEHSMSYLVRRQEYLFNLAGQTSHVDSMQDPFTDLEINARSQLSILESCRKFNPGVRVVFASTRQVYGRPQYLPVDERHPLTPVDVNGINKLAGEWYHLLYNDVYGIRACALRLTNTYGPRMRIKDARQTFLGVWIRSVLEDEAFEVWGGAQLRDFTFVDDAVEALLFAALSDEACGKVLNIGGGPPITLRDAADVLVAVNGAGRYDVREYPPERKKIDIGSFYSDDRLLRKALHWAPRWELEQGLRATLDYYRANLEYYC